MCGPCIALFLETILENHGLNLGLNVRDQCRGRVLGQRVGDVERTLALLLQTCSTSVRLIVVRRFEMPILLRHFYHASYLNIVCHLISLEQYV